MRSTSKESDSRADAIKKLEKRWLMKSKENNETPVIINRKKTRTSVTNPIDKSYSVDQSEKK
ncbi:MAG: hypothetical protein ABUT20_39955 [Bacteroidota bacterium]